jgi:hypothetical protein
MPKPPPADKIPGEIKRRPAKGKKSERPLERIRRGQQPVENVKVQPAR